jgi:hypothetical protein
MAHLASGADGHPFGLQRRVIIFEKGPVILIATSPRFSFAY